MIFLARVIILEKLFDEDFNGLVAEMVVIKIELDKAFDGSVLIDMNHLDKNYVDFVQQTMGDIWNDSKL